ncbi:MAG TPA: response regulator [Patescibacteria group bacterium]|nr:response regulator [Patescibacteria group bacterium]
MNQSPAVGSGRFPASQQLASVAAVVKPGIRTRLLIVDDETALLDLLIVYFLPSNYEVDTATNGPDALITVARQRPDAVLLDINMPRMNGIEVLKEIMKIDSSITVIMVTGNEQLPLTVDAIRNGAFGYVPKPFDLRYLDHLIAASLGRPQPPR